MNTPLGAYNLFREFVLCDSKRRLFFSLFAFYSKVRLYPAPTSMKTHKATKLRYILLTKEQLKNRLRTKVTFYVGAENGTQCLP